MLLTQEMNDIKNVNCVMQHAIYSALLNDFSNLTIDKIKVDITEVIAARKTVLGDGYE